MLISIFEKLSMNNIYKTKREYHSPVLKSEKMVILKIPRKRGDMMITSSELINLSEANIDLCSADDLVDIENVTVDKSIPINKRVEKYIETVKNPYLFKVGDVVVKTNFNPDGKQFSKAIADMIVAN